MPDNKRGQIHITNCPDWLEQALVESAERNKRSKAGEALFILESAFEKPIPEDTTKREGAKK